MTLPSLRQQGVVARESFVEIGWKLAVSERNPRAELDFARCSCGEELTEPVSRNVTGRDGHCTRIVQPVGHRVGKPLRVIEDVDELETQLHVKTVGRREAPGHGDVPL